MVDQPEEKVYLFDEFQLDVGRTLLLRSPAGESVPLTLKAFKVLLLLVENAGNLVTKDELMESVWSDSVVEEANLTQTISVLRKTLGENPNEHRFIVTESGRGYRFVATVSEAGTNGDLSNEDLEGLSDVPGEKRKPNYQKTYLALFAAAILLSLAFGASYYWNLATPPDSETSSTHSIKTLAVLPFKSIDTGDDNKVLGIGMADAVVTRLSHLKSIVVRQTNSVMRFANTTPEAIKAGREINVDAILEGNIQRADGRIRVSVRLFRVGDGALLWAESFEEPETDIFMLQDSISEKVASSLSLELNPDERKNLKRRYTENIEAYNLYSRGRYFWNKRNSEDLHKSIGFYEQAIAKDENYSLAYAGLAESYVVLQLFSPTQSSDFFPKAKQAAEKAIGLDKNLAGAHSALAVYKEQYEWDWEGAEVEFRRAISANPNYASAHQWYGEFLAFVGRTEASIAEMEKAAALDPLSTSANTARAFPYLAARQWDGVIEKVKPALELDKDFPLALYYLGRAYDGKGQYKESIEFYKRAIKGSEGGTFFKSSLIYALVKSGQKEEAAQVFKEISEIAKTEPVSKYVFARSYAALGQKEKALNELEKGFRERDGFMIVMIIDQNFDEIRKERRFQEILRKVSP